MNRSLLALLCLAPTAAVAQGYLLGAPSMGDAFHSMDLLANRPTKGLEQVFVLPERPGQNQVAWYGFDWQYVDVPAPGGGSGGIRLYYYKTEAAQARRALPAIQSEYARLVDQFHYSPTKRIPYILFATQREFQTQNVFQVTEGVLGVTSPEDLKMTVPYFGDHSRFIEVSTHEMVHQFQIQKLMEGAGSQSLSSSPIMFLPLWFTEGIAEYYSKGGIDTETDLYLRDLVWNPDPSKGYDVLPFAEDRQRGYIPTYKLGQARIAFIADVYGKEKIQAYLENAYLLGAGGPAGAGGGGGAADRGFAGLTRRVLNEPLEQVDARWRAWLKKRYYPEYLRIRQDLPQVRELRELPAEPEAFEASADGNLILFRGIDREQGRAKLLLMDARFPRGAKEIASDNQPGVESLHPIERGVMAISENRVAFSAQTGPGDALYVVPYKYTPPAKGKPPSIDIGKRRRLQVKHPRGQRFIEVSDPAFSPDGKQLAFVALTDQGGLDIYVVPIQGGTARQLTTDAFAERDIAWGPDGIYCASDATDHGRYNVFRIDPATGARTRLTTGNWNDRHPRPQADGSVLFSSDVAGKPDLYLLQDGKIRRVSDFATGLYAPATAPQARGIWAGTFYRGRFRLVEMPKVAWLDDPAVAVAPATGPVLPIPSEDFPDRTPSYEAYAWGNWRPEAGIVYGGGASNAVAGRAALLFSDILRDHVLYLDLSIYGSFELTQGLVLFENRAARTSYVFGAFHFVQQQLDKVDPNLEFLQRDFGVVTSLRFPLDRFRRVEAEFSLGAVQRYCLTDFNINNPVICGGVQSRNPNATDWDRRNGGVNPQLGPTFRYGFDTVRYDAFTGPISGSSALFELGGNYLPWRRAVSGFARADVARWFQLAGRANFSFRGAVGTSFAPDDNSRTWARSWWLTSADNLRGFYPLDLTYLIGQHFYVANAELQVPLDPIVRLAIFDYIEGVAAMDFGGVFNNFTGQPGCSPKQTVCNDGATPVQPNVLGAWDVRTLTGVLGVNVLFGPLLLRVHFGHPIDIGGVRTPAQLSNTSWVTNVTLRYFFF
ncbi:MAG: hypothetical protein ACJ79T_05540 [Myxococcales bacterium]